MTNSKRVQRNSMHSNGWFNGSLQCDVAFNLKLSAWVVFIWMAWAPFLIMRFVKFSSPFKVCLVSWTSYLLVFNISVKFLLNANMFVSFLPLNANTKWVRLYVLEDLDHVLLSFYEHQLWSGLTSKVVLKIFWVLSL